MPRAKWTATPVEVLEEVLAGWNFGPRECPNDGSTLTVEDAEPGDQPDLYCASGCGRAEILSAVGLSWQPLAKSFHEDRQFRQRRNREAHKRDRSSRPERVGPAVPVRKISMQPASKIPTRKARWLWANLIPLRTATILAGIGGIGKSTAWGSVVARLTRGTLPGECEGTPVPVAVIAYEDTWEEVIKPRLLAAGADMDLVLAVTVEREAGDDGTDVVELPGDLPALLDAVRENGVRCLVIDPVLSSFDGKINTNTSREVRKVLDPLARLAAEADLAVIAVHHLRKDADNPDAAISGAHAFRDAARSALMFTRDHERNDGSCLMFHTKSNYGVLAPPQRYQIESFDILTDEGPATVGRIVWMGDDSSAVWETAARRSDAPGESAEVREAAAWLRTEIENGAQWSTEEAVKQAKPFGWSRAVVRRAIAAIPAKATRDGFGGPVRLEILDLPAWARPGEDE